MNGEMFYEAFKKALDFLGLSCGEKEKVTVTVQENKITFSHKGLEAAIWFSKRDDET